jgi:hypothetical protein
VCRIIDASVSNAIVVGNESLSRILFVLVLPNVVDDLFLRSCQKLDADVFGPKSHARCQE